MADNHIYGSADEDNRQTPTTNGFRGEGTGALAGASPENTRTAIVAGGQTVTIEEESGVAAAEATGKVNTAAQGDANETAGSG